MINLKSAISFSVGRDDYSIEKRKCNEDSFLAPIRQNNGYLFCVADGVGSYIGAKESSTFVCDFLNDLENISNEYFSSNFSGDIQDSFRKYISNLDPDFRKAATTLSICFFDNQGLSVWHIGDCRIYIKSGNKLKQLTRDHTQYQKLLDDKIYTKAELKEKGLNKNSLITAISSFIEMKEDYFFIPMDILRQEYGDEITIIIMSDGAHHFWDLRRRFGEKTMNDIVKFSSALKRRIERFGAIDDYTVVAATFDVQDITALPIEE
ncbi:protein phosphatase 2C domain-containing protein [Wohlfahrtiimonas chitiniclastica]|uniref:PP2C family protein-serine/threonine phosphatase n=1 Tax=Wohlfahrtiimonas chitiniclastica TaxID=400946 RepID=UPI001BCB4B9F|nr:protein phosphatase 2C domain-containing protein [Wohlfahrtiimonas chitiniclastica]MBS7827373.1 protein phosphatase 2C domain-containing protein [Wohlfahrtiimonas chitiniclastica]